jgi:Beta/Gamma crystallin
MQDRERIGRREILQGNAMKKSFRSILAACLLVAVAAGFAPSDAHAQQRVPDGSYLNSCNNASVRPDDRGPGMVLVARCRNGRGDQARTSLPLPCRGDIANFNGQLVCQGRNGGGYGDNGGNGGNYGRGGRIVIFADAGFNGGNREIRDSVNNLRDIGFNDKVSSIRVDGGRWQICTDAGFRGRCEIIDRSVVNLRDWNMNDAVSSIRQVGR